MKKLFLLIGSFLISALFGIFGFAAIVQPETTVLSQLNIPEGEAIKWFGMALIAFVIPYVEQITVSGYGFKLLNEIKKTKDKIGELELIIKSQKTKSREYLIKTFNEYIEGCQDKVNGNKKIIELNEIYFEELDVDPAKVKVALNKWMKSEGNNSISEITDLTNSVDNELTETIKLFQKKKKLDNKDGIFGYYTCEKLKKYMD
jgi:murein L,D-transpeptidase YcbB/YkuD